jgi:hypothetical protein
MGSERPSEPEREQGGFGHHRSVPGRVEHHVHGGLGHAAAGPAPCRRPRRRSLSPMPQPGAVSVSSDDARETCPRRALHGQHVAAIDQTQFDDVDRNLRVVAGLQRLPDQARAAPSARCPSAPWGPGRPRRAPACRWRRHRAAQAHQLAFDPQRERAAQRLRDLRRRAGWQVGRPAVGNALHPHGARGSPRARAGGLMACVVQRVHQRVPAQQRALDAARVAAHAGQADQLAQVRRLGFELAGEHGAEALLQLPAQAPRRARARPRSSSTPRRCRSRSPGR